MTVKYTVLRNCVDEDSTKVIDRYSFTFSTWQSCGGT